MKNLNLDNICKKDDFLVIDNEKSSVIFSTAEKNKSFNRNTLEGIDTLNNLKKDFNVDKIVYLNQIHSDEVLIYNGEENFNENSGDGIITNLKNVLIGVFTADCVPVIIVNEEYGVIGAVHSGWKGTIKSITKVCLDKMTEVYGVNHKNTKVYIGPHIRKCCYEISEDLKERFIEEKDIDKDILFDGRNLNLEACIEKDAKDCGVNDENIKSIPLCTYCEKDIKLHSYRKSDGSYGRLFTFAILK